MNNTEQQATWIGGLAILLWSTLALLTKLGGSEVIPSFQFTATVFTIAFVVGLFMWLRAGQAPWPYLRLPPSMWALGVYGLFGYHFFYFLSFRYAPAVEVNLINYLWPLLIVLFSAFLPQERLRWYHLAGAGLGFVGVGVLILQDNAQVLSSQHLVGYALALICAFIWSSYSVASRYYGQVPTLSIGGFCGATAVLALVGHLTLEETVWPTAGQGVALTIMGIGPLGMAFFAWDYGVKKGNIKLLGVFSYGAPVLSTLLLILFGFASLSWQVGVACALVAVGAVLASGRWLPKNTP